MPVVGQRRRGAAPREGRTWPPRAGDLRRRWGFFITRYDVALTRLPFSYCSSWLLGLPAGQETRGDNEHVARRTCRDMRPDRRLLLLYGISGVCGVGSAEQWRVVLAFISGSVEVVLKPYLHRYLDKKMRVRFRDS